MAHHDSHGCGGQVSGLLSRFGNLCSFHLLVYSPTEDAVSLLRVGDAEAWHGAALTHCWSLPWADFQLRCASHHEAAVEPPPERRYLYNAQPLPLPPPPPPLPRFLFDSLSLAALTASTSGSSSQPSPPPPPSPLLLLLLLLLSCGSLPPLAPPSPPSLSFSGGRSILRRSGPRSSSSSPSSYRT